MIVEVQGMGFWTRVRLPPNPLNCEASNTYPSPRLAVYKNVFALVIDINDDECNVDAHNYSISFRGIRAWIKDMYDVELSNSSISMVRDKCGIEKIEINARYKEIPSLKSKKEQLVLEAFKHFNIVQE